MNRVHVIEPEFVQEIPPTLEAGTLYISILYGTVIHLCCCGCGNEVVTPLHPTRWTLIYNGERVSLRPSVGSWSLPCQSHYIIEKNRVRWAARWSDERIQAVRARDRRDTAAHFGDTGPPHSDGAGPLQEPGAPTRRGIVSRLWSRVKARPRS